jgi:hypothetical protein
MVFPVAKYSKIFPGIIPFEDSCGNLSSIKPMNFAFLVKLHRAFDNLNWLNDFLTMSFYFFQNFII